MSQSSRLRSRCPHCQRWVVGGAVHLSKQVICPGCKREFRFAVQRPGAVAAAAKSEPSASGRVDLRNPEIPPHVLELIPVAMARTKNILPLEIDQDTVIIAAPDAMAFDLQQQLEFMLGRQVRLVQAPAPEIAFAVQRFYETPEEAEQRSVNGQDTVASHDSDTSSSSGDLDADIRRTVKGTIEAAFQSAVQRHATRIIFSHPKGSALEIHYQLKDGKRVEAPAAPQHLADRIVTYLKSNIGRDGDAILDIGGTRNVLKADRHHDASGEQIVLYIERQISATDGH